MFTKYLHRDIIYGPVRSRRLGLSLGVNVWPKSHKVCSFDCIYCECGAYRASRGDDPRLLGGFVSPRQVADALQHAFDSGLTCEHITFSGNGEATLHPQFGDIVEAIRDVRDTMAPEVAITLLSNSTRVHDPAVRAAIERVDLPIMKLDAGEETLFRKLNHPAADVHFTDIIAGLKMLRRFHMQTMILDGDISNCGDAEVAAWIRQVGYLKPESVQLYTLDRPAPYKGIHKVGKERMQEIARQCERETGVQVDVFA